MRTMLSLLIGTVLLGGAESIPVVPGNDPAFAAVLAPGAVVEKLADHGKGTFLEGPVWLPEGFLVYSDIPRDRLLRWPPLEGTDGVFRNPSGKTNGNALWQGRLLSCQQTPHRLAATGSEGRVTTLTDAFAGKPFNSPNDLALHPDGAIWFTDPTWGMRPRTQEQEYRGVYRFDPATGTVTAVVTDFEQPNGICFSPDHQTLYIAETGKKPLIRAFRVVDGKTLADSRVFTLVSAGVPDGMKVDTEGRLYAGIKTGVEVFAADGRRLGLIPVPETTANLCFGGADRRTLYMTASTSLYRIPVLTTGAL